jgi:hypothetical protein
MHRSSIRILYLLASRMACPNCATWKQAKIVAIHDAFLLRWQPCPQMGLAAVDITLLEDAVMQATTGPGSVQQGRPAVCSALSARAILSD